MRGLVTRPLRAASTLALLLAAAAHAQELTVTKLEHYTDNRGWNEAGLGPAHQVIVTATVTPPPACRPWCTRKRTAREGSPD